MLLKDPQARPTAEEILSSNIVQKYMALLIKESCDLTKMATIYKDKDGTNTSKTSP